jgi:hypothetical protein
MVGGFSQGRRLLRLGSVQQSVIGFPQVRSPVCLRFLFCLMLYLLLFEIKKERKKKREREREKKEGRKKKREKTARGLLCHTGISPAVRCN